MTSKPPICIVVLAHNEEARIAACLNSLPLNDTSVAIHLVVNGSTDATAAIAGGIAAAARNVKVHIFDEGGKARSWNRLLFEELEAFHDTHIFVDGDAEVVPGSVAAMAAALSEHPAVDAVAGLPMNGRKMHSYQQQMREQHGLFGDLYALRGSFLERMKRLSIRLPDDVIGDDGLICAMVKTSLGPETQWDDERVAVCEAAGFLCEPVRLFSPSSLRMQYRRMINYSIRHFQNQMISRIMRDIGPKGLPHLLSDIYRRELPSLVPRSNPVFAWFDRLALRRMARAVKPA